MTQIVLPAVNAPSNLCGYAKTTGVLSSIRFDPSCLYPLHRIALVMHCENRMQRYNCRTEWERKAR
jgi:hypothetical protein